MFTLLLDYRRTILFFILVMLFNLTAMAQSTLNDGILALQTQRYEVAERIFKQVLQKDPDAFVAQYGLAKTMLGQHLERRDKWETMQRRLMNYESELKILMQAYPLAEKANDTYNQISDAEKSKQVKTNIRNDRRIERLPQQIATAAAELLLNAPYNVHYKDIPNIQPYNDPMYADTVANLRDALVGQMNTYLDFYQKSNSRGSVANARKVMLQQYIRLEGLRLNGTGYGYLYEKYCDCILESFEPRELEHILPQFYGADYEWTARNYLSSAAYKKLDKIAKKHKITVLDLFCKMNMHYKGYHPENAELYEDFIKAIAPAEIAFVALQKKSAYFVHQKKYEQAANVYRQYKDLFPSIEDRLLKIFNVLKAAPDNLKLENLGPNVNTNLPETHPVPTIDGKYLYFCRKHIASGQDIYVSEKRGKQFSPAKRVAASTQTHEVPQSVSADGKTLVVFGNYSMIPDMKVEMLAHTKKLGSGDVFYVDKTSEDAWSRIRPFPNNINSEHYEAGFSFTADGEAAFFVSDRPGGIGKYLPKGHPDYLFFRGREDFNQDIYVVEKKGKGWGQPINLGEIINTPYGESMPFLHPDMKTLYFVSDGHYGIGGADIYMSKRLSDTDWTQWSEPINLGKSINSPDDDGFYLDISGKFAYIVLKDRPDGYGDYDIYRFEMPERFRPEPVGIMQGTVTDGSGTPIETEIIWEDLKTGRKEGSKKTKKDGSFNVIVPSGKHYGFYTQKKGHITISGSIDLETSDQTTSETSSIELISIDEAVEQQRKIRLNNIFFDFDSYTLKRTSFPELKRLIQILNDYPHLSVFVQGHTDAVGKPDYNLGLSKNRAEAVMKHLILMGIDADRITFEGYGQTQPIATNKTDEGRALNRRVEFTLKKR
ncbi:MAG: OmpA family protein [Bernardetiaceae bacterium]|nr:OmpA family protein [Bernardetiaceae bacterium]